jgi:hypothetical protein
MKRFIKHFYYNTKLGHLIIFPIKKIYKYYYPRLIPEKLFIKLTFKSILGYTLNLDNPKTLNEKIQWIQRYKRTPLHTKCSDKYAVRKYIEEKIGKEYLIPLLYHTTDTKDIVPEKMPDYPFIIKTNHGCGGHIIVKDKSEIDWKTVQKYLKNKLKRNYYYTAREWQYKDIMPSIIVEKLLLDKNSNIPCDYKFHCFNGHVEIITVDMDRQFNFKRNLYDKDWNFIDCRMRLENGADVKKPIMLNKMKSLAETLANEFYYIRVDLYNVKGKIYFGELTFSPAGGRQKYFPPIWDRKFGDQLKL